MVSRTDIANMALGHLGIGNQISDLDLDVGVLAKGIRLYFDSAVEKALQDRDWNFARRNYTLLLVAEDPSDEWEYSYRWPALCVQPLRIVSGMRPDTELSKIPFNTGSDDSGRLIFTNQEDAILEYVHLVTDPTIYPSGFTLALSALIAVLAAPRLASSSGRDTLALSDRAAGLYMGLTSAAAVADGDGNVRSEEPVSSIERARDG